MKFGGMILKKWRSPAEWARLALEAGYTAVYFPVNHKARQGEIDAYAEAARSAGLVIAEVGVWNNVLDPDPVKREEAVAYAIHQLELADYVGANCCVNIAGSYNAEHWDGPHRDNMTEKGFDDIVAAAQRIVDAVKPTRTAYTLEPMPWMYPDTADSCLALIRAVDRRGFAAHLDMVNVISSPQLYYRNGEVIREWFTKLGPYIRSCHCKDIRLRPDLTVHLDECRPGQGELDYRAYLTCASKLEDNVTLMLEHMTEPEDYTLGTAYVKGVARELGLTL